MELTHLDVFDSTVEKANMWLIDLMQELGMDDDRGAYNVLRTALHALRDRLPVAEVAAFGAQLPMLIRGLYYEDWDPTADQKGVTLRRWQDLLSRTEQDVDDGSPPDAHARAVFAVVSRNVSARG
jgi:uncharacterized protein (DUF2267 family)